MTILNELVIILFGGLGKSINCDSTLILPESQMKIKENHVRAKIRFSAYNT